MVNKEAIKKHIRKNYSVIAQKGSQGGCCSGGCSCGGNSFDIKEASLRLGYEKDDFINIPENANMRLGCGNPIAIAALKERETVLDLGCGGGFDCFLARRKVGKEGFVIGVDMTPDMVHLARANAVKSGYDNMDFRLGEIEHLPVENGVIDVIISNCVINLSTDKKQVFNEAFRVLKKGGRLSISDIVATAELPAHIKADLSMMSGCIAGAEYIDNIFSMLTEAGFSAIVMTPKDNSREIISSWQQDKNIEDYVASFIIQATK